MARRPRGSGLTAISMTEIQAELRRRARMADTLRRKRARLMAKLVALDDRIRDLGGVIQRGPGRPPGSGRVGAIPGRKRPRNESNLADALAKVLKGKTMGVTEAAEAVQKAGYRTSAANFRTIVNQCLIKNNKTFKKVERGQYTAA
jgi:hypothetical protein